MAAKHKVGNMPELLCGKCGTWMILTFSDRKLKRRGVTLLIHRCPILHCPNCRLSRSLANQVGRKARARKIQAHKAKSGFVVVKLHHAVDSSNRFQIFRPDIFNRLIKAKKTSSTFIPRIPKRRFAWCAIEFLYDARDYYYIPGLYRSSGDGFLTPVFFAKGVLLKYLHHPAYSLDFSSDTYGTIHTSEGHIIAFGVNRVGRVIMWLADIGKMSEAEQFYLRSENVESDHDVASEFYQGQVEVQFTPPTREWRLLRARHEMINRAFEILKVKLAHLDIEQAKVMKRILRPLVWDEPHVGSVIDALNKVMIETLNVEAIKADIRKIDHNFEAKSLRSLKLFQFWLEKRCRLVNAASIVSPLFILYDLRVVLSHLLSREKEKKTLSHVCSRLQLAIDCRNWEKIYDAMLDRLQTTYTTIIERIEVVRNGAGEIVRQ